MNVTQSIFRRDRKNGETLGLEFEDDLEPGQIITSEAEVPVEIPVTERIFRDLWIPPNFLAHPRPAWTEMRNYAHYAPWLGGGNRWVRELGIWYFRLVATPLTAVLRGVEWLIERPARLIVAGTLIWWGVSLITK
jgi:hypothetical protein